MPDEAQVFRVQRPCRKLRAVKPPARAGTARAVAALQTLPPAIGETQVFHHSLDGRRIGGNAEVFEKNLFHAQLKAGAQERAYLRARLIISQGSIAQSGEEDEQSLPEFIEQLEVLFVPDAAAHSVNN